MYKHRPPGTGVKRTVGVKSVLYISSHNLAVAETRRSSHGNDNYLYLGSSSTCIIEDFCHVPHYYENLILFLISYPWEISQTTHSVGVESCSTCVEEWRVWSWRVNVCVCMCECVGWTIESMYAGSNPHVLNGYLSIWANKVDKLIQVETWPCKLPKCLSCFGCDYIG